MYLVSFTASNIASFADTGFYLSLLSNFQTTISTSEKAIAANQSAYKNSTCGNCLEIRETF